MAGSLTDTAEVDILKMITAQATSVYTTTVLSNLYVALCTTASSDSAAGTEVSGGSYARIDSKTKWGTPSAGSVSNNAAITFATATGSWGTVTYFELWTAVSGGTRLAWGDLATPRAIVSGDAPSFAAGTLVIELS